MGYINLKITYYEAIALAGIIGAGKGKILHPVYIDLINKLDKEDVKIADMMSEILSYRNSEIDEDELMDEAIAAIEYEI